MAINILIAVNSLEKGGRTKRVVEEYEGLLQRGHNVTLVTFSQPPRWVLKQYASSSSWKVLNKSKLKFDPLLLARFLRVSVAEKIEIIDAHCEMSAFYGGLVSKILRRSSVGTIHRSLLRYYEPTFKNRLYYRFLNGFVAVSGERKDRMINQLGLKDNNLPIVHWGIDPGLVPDELNPSDMRKTLHLPNCKIILSLGHLGIIKGHDDSINALPTVLEKFPKAKLYIAGDGTMGDYERLHELIESLKLQNSVILLGQITNPLEWMQACDIFLQPSLEEAFGLVFLEAGLCRKPTVATRVGGIPEIVIEKETGLLVEPGSPGQISASLIELLSSNELRVEMGEKANEWIHKQFLLNDQLLKLEEYFSSIVNRKTAPARS